MIVFFIQRMVPESWAQALIYVGTTNVLLFYDYVDKKIVNKVWSTPTLKTASMISKLWR
jgi:hypothetical protein